MKLFVFGLGYSASRFVAEYGGHFSSITATNRNPVSTTEEQPRAKLLSWMGDASSTELDAAVAQSQTLLVSIPPSEKGDPAINAFGPLLERSSHLQTVVYLSTIGVYGNHDGRWVDEETIPKPVSERSTWRLAAERQWSELAKRKNFTLHILRLAGIYGPGRNALENQRAGTVRNIVKPGQIFNRIHVDDISQSIWRAIAQTKYASDGRHVHVWNVTDDEPAPPQDVKAYAAQLLSVAAPPEISIGDANLSPMGLSFYSEKKRVSNARLKNELGIVLRYPTYREGLNALLDM